jgi:hypothetical protein
VNDSVAKAEVSSGLEPNSKGAANSPEAGAVSADKEKLASIAELISLMEETHKGRDWLLDQIKQKRQRIKVKPTMGIVAILKCCSVEFILNLLDRLRNHEIDHFDPPPPLTETYHWFFTDIVSGSDPTLTTNEQARKIIVLNKLMEMTNTLKERDSESMIILPTGDGMAVGFADSPEKPLRLALELHQELARYNKTRTEKDKILVRIGLDTGPVYIINDLNGNENVWGPGIILARRVMDIAREMNILASARFANDVKMLRPEYRQILHPIGDYQIKHGEKILLYNVYGDNFGNKRSPRESLKQKSKAEEEIRKTSSRFLFNQVDLGLEVTDMKTMMTHHNIVWRLVNIAEQPAERVFYYIDGDTPKSFPDLNVTIKDEDDRELEIMSLNVNKPFHKEFFVRLRKPLAPGEKGRVMRLEYDWEEPERHYLYRLASDCKKLNYHLVVPKQLEISQKVAVIDPETGDKNYSSVPASVKYLADRTEVSWQSGNLKSYDTFRFDW